MTRKQPSGAKTKRKRPSVSRKWPENTKTKRNRPSVSRKWPENSPAGQKLSGSGQALGKTKRMRLIAGQKWPENSPAGQKLSEIGKRWPKLARKQSSGGKLSGCGQALGKTKRMRPIAGQKWPENCPAGQKLSEIGKRWPKLARKQSSGALRIYASM